MIVEFVNPKYSSVSCPKCGQRIVKVGYRYFRCLKYGYENDGDVIAVWEGFSEPLDCHSIDEEKPRW